jgi:hypothetical protein
MYLVSFFVKLCFEKCVTGLSAKSCTERVPLVCRLASFDGSLLLGGSVSVWI